MAISFIKKSAPVADHTPAQAEIPAAAPAQAPEPSPAPAPSVAVKVPTAKLGSFMASKLASSVPSPQAEVSQSPADSQMQVAQEATPVQAASPQVHADLTPLQATIIEIGAVHKQMVENNVDELSKEFAKLKGVLAAEAAKPEYPTTQEVDFSYDGIHVIFSTPSAASKVKDPAKVVEMLGQELFNKLATVSITDLKKYLTPLQLQEVLEETTGARRLKSLIVPDKG